MLSYETCATAVWLRIQSPQGISDCYNSLQILLQVLLEAPVGTGLGIVMGITGMGANDFMDFLLSYFVDLGLIMLFRVNIDPALGDILEAIGET